ncbi:MAG TPA: pantetheine-phosphate adenylyltransferase [Alphaproteobacteria bacterium]|nr:pantetheine-phosphate adenylyltransferase [Alphaproteobacteria bacterium]
MAGKVEPMGRVAVYPGTFDPVTHGHIDIMERSLRLFDRLYVGVFDNLSKSVLFSNQERIEMIRKATSHLPGLEVEAFNSLLVDYAKARGACAIIRGLRAVSDFDYEFQMTLMNRKLDSIVETVFMMPSEEYVYVSSRLIKEVVSLGGRVTGLVPDFVEEALIQRLGQRR